RVVVMNKGRIEQPATPFEIYNRPATRFVAGFVGTLNLLDCTVVDRAAGIVRIGDNVLTLGLDLDGRGVGDVVSLALRPEAIALGGERANQLDVTIREVSFLGSVIRVKVELGDQMLSIDTFNTPAAPPPVAGVGARISFHSDDLLVL